MTLTLTAYSPSGSAVVNDYKTLTYATEGTTRGKVAATAGADTPTRTVRIGEVERPVLMGGLHIPISADLPVAGEQRGKGWEYAVTAVGVADDPSLLGRRYLVVGVPGKSFATARRLDVVEL